MNWKNFIKAMSFCTIMFFLIYFSYIPFVFFLDTSIAVVCGICILLFILNMIFDFFGGDDK